MELYTDSWAVASVLAEGQGLKGNMIGKLVIVEIWERDMWIDPSEWAKDLKIFMSYVGTHERMASAEEYFNNQVDRMTCSVATSLSSATAVIAQWAYEQNGYGDRNGSYVCTPSCIEVGIVS